MVWFEAAHLAISDSGKKKTYFIAFVNDHSGKSQCLERLLNGEKISKLIEPHACYQIDTRGSEWDKFQTTFNCDVEPQLVLVSPEKCKRIIRFNGDANEFIKLLQELIGQEVSNAETDVNPTETVDDVMDSTVKVKFVTCFDSWVHTFDKLSTFGELREHVAKKLNLSLSEFLLISRLPRLVLDFDQDTKTLEDMSLYPSCVLHININPMKSEANKSQSYGMASSVFAIVSSIFATILSIFYFIIPNGYSYVKNGSSNVPESNHSSRDVHDSEKDKDDENKRETDNGNSTLLM
ncbi:hypothetical protein RF11_15732 [Thelohanellus kitauei]|uniref:UBX domain-containing protein 4 n=1 Tax=Thelohanellus kitauei TaxID=669202 RepID=A0A0C2N7N0_THEKT|nr:hypothetical protein RF11_15732 [Thelohanellus kitauei]